ncbi:MAG TPA: zinc-dependent metalloprotease, partial [Puia sp.]|nr:zinc-dependent metalloprotease [Puia sp.]
TYSYTYVALPRVPMQARIHDRRVGFFPGGSRAYFSDDQQRVKNYAIIPRWRLEPRPEDVEKWKRGELVEPAKPIVYYITPNTPKRWVKYLIAGVNDWQKAFEQAGFKNAIIAKEWPEGTTADLYDARYSFICYLPSRNANASGPHIFDPRSGEVIQSHVDWYHNVMVIVDGWYKTQASSLDPAARKERLDDELMGQLIRFVSSHEVGHTLGLAHNMGASSQSPVEKLRDKGWLKQHGHTASIMDYARFNYVAQPEDSIPQEELWPHIGEYDRWAIQWGYKHSGETDPQKDRLVVSKWVTDSLANNPQLWFGSEEGEITNIPGVTAYLPFDPRVQSECVGDNNMTGNAYGIL